MFFAFQVRMNVQQDKGIIWFSDGGGQVFKGRLVDYDREKTLFWVHATRECPREVVVVVILKDGQNFPSGKVEWCGKTNLVSTEQFPDSQEGYYRLCLKAASPRSGMSPNSA